MKNSFSQIVILKWKRAVALLLAAVLAGCAAQGPPGGGPVDKTGPLLMSSFPEEGSVNVDRETDVVLNFSELIEPRSAESNLVITPAPATPAIVKVNRKRITVSFVEPLQENTTYIISFGRGIQDYQKNLSEKNITLAFSTGDSLDAGAISGTVYDIPKKHRVQVWAFRKTGSFPDSILGHTPDYKTSVEKDGRYRLTNLSKGDYRLLAVSSESPKITFIDENCLLGIPAIDPVTVTNRNAVVTDVDFRLGKFYLKPFRLLKANMVDDKTELIFSRPLHAEKSVNAVIRIDNDAQVQSYWVSTTDPKTMILNTREMVPDTEYTILVDSVFDDHGEIIGTHNGATFIYSAGVDTLGPEIAATTPAQAARNVPLNIKVRIVFNEAIAPTISDTSILFMSKDSSLVEFSLRWQCANAIVLSPVADLTPATEYRITCDFSDGVDPAGNKFQDSLFVLSFSTVDINSFGSISGSVSLSDTNVSRLRLSCIPEKEDASPVCVNIPASGQYSVEGLLPGAYRFAIWEDRNGNGKWDPGRLQPFTPAEPYRSFPDKINVRARWETAEVDWIY